MIGKILLICLVLVAALVGGWLWSLNIIELQRMTWTGHMGEVALRSLGVLMLPVVLAGWASV